MKKISKKLLIVVLVVISSIVAFDIGASRERYAADEAVLKVAKHYTKESTSYNKLDSNVASNIRVTEHSPYYTDELQFSSFSVDTLNKPNRNIVVAQVIKKSVKPYSISNTSVFDAQVLRTSQCIVFKYIDRSDILKEKESIKIFLSSIPIKCSSFKDKSTDSYYDTENNVIYIRPTKICRSTIINEYINAISYYTHGRKFCAYQYTKLNQIITNLIATGLSRESYHLDYMSYSPLVYPYINLFGDEAIKAYFYGYEAIYKAIPKEEFNFWIAIVDNFDDNYKEYYDNLLFKWYSYATIK